MTQRAAVGITLHALLAADSEAYSVSRALSRVGEVYVVGDAVSDVIQGWEPSDYEFVVEGSVDDARDQLERLGGHVVIGDTKLAYMGEDTYLVSCAPIKDVLRARVTTSSAIGVQLRDGRVVDPFGGAADVRAGRLRLLRNAQMREPAETTSVFVACAHGLVPDERLRKKMAQTIDRLEPDALDELTDDEKHNLASILGVSTVTPDVWERK